MCVCEVGDEDKDILLFEATVGEDGMEGRKGCCHKCFKCLSSEQVSIKRIMSRFYSKKEI